MIEVCLLDVDQVLIFRKDYFGNWLKSRFDIDFDKTDEFFKKVFPSCQIGKRDLRKELGKVVSAWGWKGSVSEMIDLWLKIEDSRIDRLVLEEVKHLRSKNVKCFLASNQEKYRAGDVLKKIGKYFNGHFFSWEIGALKKERSYWRSVILRLQIPPNEIVFWDDDESDVAKARKEGIDARVYRRIGDFKREVAKLNLG